MEGLKELLNEILKDPQKFEKYKGLANQFKAGGPNALDPETRAHLEQLLKDPKGAFKFDAEQLKAMEQALKKMKKEDLAKNVGGPQPKGEPGKGEPGKGGPKPPSDRPGNVPTPPPGNEPDGKFDQWLKNFIDKMGRSSVAHLDRNAQHSEAWKKLWMDRFAEAGLKAGSGEGKGGDPALAK